MSQASDPGRISETGAVGVIKRSLQWSSRTLHLALFRRPLPRRVAIYLHYLDDSTASALETLIPFFKQRGYAFVDAKAFDEEAEPERPLTFLSFDDNYLSWYERRSLFTRHKVGATFYVNSIALDRHPDDPVVRDYYRRLGGPPDRRPLRSAHLRELAEEGHGIACHTHSHLNLAVLEPQALKEEIDLNRQIIQSALGSPVVDFSFPFGQPRHLPPEVERQVRGAGFARIAHATGGMQYVTPRRGTIHRALWRPEQSLDCNLAQLCVDGRWFVRLCGRSPLG